MSPRDEELEALLSELAPSPAKREALLEEHRQLEKDLLRLADPPPPGDFLAGVMAKVAANPARALTKRDIVTSALIIGVTGSLGLLLLVLSSALHVDLATELATIALNLRQAVVAAGSALVAVWRTAALPLVMGLGFLFLACVAAIRRLSPQPQLKVIS